MIHVPNLIQDLSVILVAGGAVTLLCKWLKQPVVLGYLIAGLMVGPHVPFFPTITERESIQVWAEIGVIFLLFALGLEFSFKKLLAVGRPASITAIVEVICMLSIGFLIGRALGWKPMDSIFLGGILSISSTTIIVRAFNELNLKGRGFVSLVFGTLVVEDLIAILLLVLLSTIAVTRSFAGGELLFASAKLGFFLALWFIVGVYLVPTFLERIRRFLSDETILVVSLGLCLSMVLLAAGAGFSPALGAFVMGSILAETRDGKRIEEVIAPVRDLFAAVFFVSIGMLLDPSILAKHGGVILLISVVTIVGKILSTSLGALLSGQPLKTSVQAGMSLAQIGEFSFIIATLGLTLNVTSNFLYPIAVAVSAITTFTTPYLIIASERTAAWLDTKLPLIVRQRLERYQRAFESDSNAKSALALILSAYGPRVLVNAVLVIGIFVGAKELLLPMVQPWIKPGTLARTVTMLFALAASAPFLWGMILGKARNLKSFPVEQLQRLRTLNSGVTVFRLLLASALTLTLISQLLSAKAASALLFALLFATALLARRFAEPVYRFVETRFIENLDGNRDLDRAKESPMPELAPWNSSLAEFTLSPDSSLVGKSLVEAKIRERFGVTIAMIGRGKRRIVAPTGSERLFPFDRLFIVGTEAEVLALQSWVEGAEAGDLAESVNFGLHSIFLNPNSALCGLTIRESGMREKVDGLIIGIERKGRRILNPDSTTSLSSGDRLWIVGDREKIARLA